ncbi:MAG: peptide deformylase [Planctomycetaceae bacterium]|nr:peptide deformylase [Planctomycetaceae bacterium]
MQIIKYPHPILRHKCKPVKRIDQGLRDIIAEMLVVMYDDDGVGLAANQIGLPYRIFVLNTSGNPEHKDNEFVFINPVMSKKKGSAESDEGCLSFPAIHAPVVRPDEIVIQGVGLDGQVREYHWKGFAAKAAQHEMDHINGMSFIDRLSPANLLAVREQLEELEMQFETNRRLKLIQDDAEIVAVIEEMERRYC